jgi:hypothetical protein
VIVRFHAACLAPWILSLGCSAPQPHPEPSAAPSATSAPAPVGVAPESAAPSAPANTVLSAPSASAGAVPTPSAEPNAIATVTPPPTTTASAEAPLPKVKVENIGMHIGGGPNDEPTKAPIHRSVSPHFDDFRRCFALAEDPKKGGSFGVDLMIPKDGGKAIVTKPRTSLDGKPFRECVVHTFESIDFLKPKGGKTKVSYSLQFTP